MFKGSETFIKIRKVLCFYEDINAGIKEISKKIVISKNIAIEYFF